MICKKCVMDSTDPNIVFNEYGFCNHCLDFIQKFVRMKIKRITTELSSIFRKMKKEMRDKPYDCILGISGGLDSSYVAYIAYRAGLRVLLVHLDNGYNTPEAEHNIEQIVEYTGFAFIRYFIDQEEFRDIELAFLRAAVHDFETVTDQAIGAIIMKTAIEHGIKYVLSGGNVASEGIFPTAWAHNHHDTKNIKNIHKKFGTRKLRTYPLFGIVKRTWYTKIRRMKIISVLNYLDYQREDAIRTLMKDMNWRSYGDKHAESIITRFFQFYMLPERLGIDTRKAYLSTLICTGQITRKDALEKLTLPPYKDPTVFEKDFDFVLNYLQLSKTSFHRLMAQPVIPNEAYGTDIWHRRSINAVLFLPRVIKRIIKKVVIR